jgi:hypothetical protein
VCEEAESGWLDKGYEEAEDIWGDKTGKPRNWMLSNVYSHGVLPSSKTYLDLSSFLSRARIYSLQLYH